MLNRTGVADYTCPKNLTHDFVDGQQYSEKYTFTSLVVKLCDENDGDLNCRY